MIKDIVRKILIDAKKNHNIIVNENDTNIKNLVSYVLNIGYNNGYKDCKKENLKVKTSKRE